MRSVLAAGIVAAVLYTGGAGVADANQSFYGLWRTQTDGDATVRLEPCGDRVCGFIVNAPTLAANPDQLDERNSDPASRNRRLAGLQFLETRPAGANRLDNGWVYDPEDGNTYSGSIRLLEDGRLRLTGCVVWPLCRTQTWRRIG